MRNQPMGTRTRQTRGPWGDAEQALLGGGPDQSWRRRNDDDLNIWFPAMFFHVFLTSRDSTSCWMAEPALARLATVATIGPKSSPVVRDASAGKIGLTRLRRQPWAGSSRSPWRGRPVRSAPRSRW